MKKDTAAIWAALKTAHRHDKHILPMRAVHALLDALYPSLQRCYPHLCLISWQTVPIINDSAAGDCRHWRMLCAADDIRVLRAKHEHECALPETVDKEKRGKTNENDRRPGKTAHHAGIWENQDFSKVFGVNQAILE